MKNQEVRETKKKLAEALTALHRKRTRDLFKLISPNPTQKEFINSTSLETMLRGPNQFGGKSTALQMAATIFLTGLYPDWYTGWKPNRPIHMVIASETGRSTRDVMTNDLLGPYGDRGSGMIPEDLFSEKDITYLTGGVYKQIETFKVKHFTDGEHDGMSTCTVFSYSTGWKPMQGITVDAVLVDEEPPADVLRELRLRVAKQKGPIFIACTPLQGETEVMREFEDDDLFPHCKLIKYGLWECTHIPRQDLEDHYERCKNYPDAMARLFGEPVRGEGPILWMQDEELMEEPFKIPDHWSKLIGLDFPHTATGTFAAVKVAIDPEADCIHLISEYKAKGKAVAQHAEALRGMGGRVVPIAWPHDGNRASGTSTIIKQYRDHGLNTLPKPAHFIDVAMKVNNATKPAIDELMDRAGDGRFRVFSNCREFFLEKRQWAYKNGKIAKGVEDHIMDALLKCIMMQRYSQHGSEEGGGPELRSFGDRANPTDLDFFTDFSGDGQW